MKKRILFTVVILVGIILLPLIGKAQFVPIDANKARVQASFNSVRTYINGADTIVVANVRDTTNTLNGGGYMIMADSDTSLFYHKDDTARLFTTASSWLFTPSLPCCTPDTIPLNFITTQCTTVTANKWRPVLTDSLGRASTTACDTISYLYVDSFFAGNVDSSLFQVGSGVASLMDKRSIDAAGANTTVIGATSSIDFNSFESSTYGSFNSIADSSFGSNIFGTSNIISDTSYQSVALGANNSITKYSYYSTTLGTANNIFKKSYQSNSLGYNNSIQDTSYQSSILGFNNIIQKSYQSFAFGNNIVIFNKPKSIALGLNVTPTDSNQLAISDSIKTVLLKLNVATAGANSVLTTDANGIATWDNQTLSGSATLDFGSISPNSFLDLTITVVGASLSDPLALGIPESSVTAEVEFSARVSAPDTVTVRAQNVNGGNPDPASGLFKVKVFK